MHKSMTVSIAFIAISCVVVAGAWVGTARTQTVHETIRQSLVYLKATAKGASGQTVGVMMETNATGFLVSEDGLILTVYHLISELGDVVPETVRIEARIGEKNANPKRAMTVDASINTDLLVLKIPPGTKEYTKVSLGSANSHNDTDAVYTSGFPKSITYRKQENKIEAREGPGGYLWTTGLKFEHGQSGSPIYNAAGEVIGVVKGDEGTLSYMIPIGFADSLLAQVRFGEIKKALQDFEHLRRQFTWIGEVDGGKITIRYEKSVAGEPHVASIDLKIRPVGLKDGREQKLTDFPMPDVKRTALIGQTGGAFEINDLQARIDRYRVDFGFVQINEIEVDIVPTLTDASVLRRKRITIDYR